MGLNKINIINNGKKVNLIIKEVINKDLTKLKCFNSLPENIQKKIINNFK